jgi:hypothetical protein
VSHEHGWMRPALDALFDSVSVEEAREAVLSDERRTELRSTLNQDLGTAPIPDGQYADNLLQGLLALRMKFDRAEAIQKLELNLSMRSGRGAHR